MDTKSITAVIIGLMVSGLILVAFVPIFTEVTATEDTYTNDGYFRMTHYDTDAEITLTWSVDNPLQVVVNDVIVPINYNITGSVTIIADTNFIARLSTTPNDVSLAYISSGVQKGTATVGATYTFSNGNATIVNVSESTSTYTTTYTDLYIPSLDGTFVMKKYDESAYINEDSFVFAYGLTRINNSTGIVSAPGVGLEFSGSIEDGVDGRVWRGADNTTLSNEQINYVPVDSHIDLYKFDSITATATYSETIEDETVTTDTVVTYNYLLVPYQVTAEKSVHGDSAFNSVINIIPLLAGVGLLMAGVYYFISRK